MLVSWSKPAPSAVTSLATIRSADLTVQLAAGVFGDVIGLGGKAHQNARRAGLGVELGHVGENVGRGFQFDGEALGRTGGAFDLGCVGRHGTVIGNRGGHHHDGGFG